jgi:nucleotide-binding universal stress UspA family protein
MPVNVIVPLDGSETAERALGCGQVLSEHTGGQLILVASAERDKDYDDLATYLNGVETSQDARRELRARVGPAKTIDTVARHWAPSLVCMSSRGASGRSSAVLGSVTAEVLAQGAAPVLIVGPAVQWNPTIRCDSVLLYANDSPDSVAAAEAGKQLAATLGVALQVVTVDTKADTRGAYDTTRAQLDEVGVTEELEVLVSGDVVDALVDRASTPGTVLAMASHGRTRTQKLVAGSVALSVIARAANPVLVVSPHRAARDWRDWGLTAS